MPTLRQFAKKAFHAGIYEGQDVLVDVDDVDLISLQPGRGFEHRDKWFRKLLFRDPTSTFTLRNPGLCKVKLTREYDLFLAVCQNYWDLIYVNAVDGWKDKCRVSACWIDEMWIADLPEVKILRDALDRFDYLFLSCRGTVEPLSKALGRQCYWLPGAVDTARFSPYPNPPERVIDVYSIGRRWEGIHNVLREATSQDFFYLHDTFLGMAKMDPQNHRHHRDLLANVAKRSRCFSVAPGKMDRPDETEDQVEIGLRYYEGSAAGTVMIGQAPKCLAFEERFPWPDVVIPLNPDGSDTISVLNQLRSEPERMAEIGHRNATEALLRHDWVYRWEELLRTVGLSPAPAMVARQQKLMELSAEGAEISKQVRCL